MSREVGPWVMVEDGCGAARVIVGGDPNNIADRVAFIEKTPRVRIRDHRLLQADKDFLNWASGPFKGDGPEDPESRDWCDQALVLFGYTLPEQVMIGKPVYFTGVPGVRLVQFKTGWMVQYHPESNNHAERGWITVGEPYANRAEAEEMAPSLMPPGHEF